MTPKIQAAIFDLDGVIVDTAKYHYLAWKRLANLHGFDFTEAQNEALKGVSRRESLEILLDIGCLQVDEAARQRMANQKNEWYVAYIQKMGADEILPGAANYLRFVRAKGIKTALGSASKNARLILERLGIQALFDAVVDGTQVRRSKPDPEVFLRAAVSLGVAPQACMVFEDAQAGIAAARRGGMFTVGVGQPENLKEADIVVRGLDQMLLLAFTDQF